MFKLALRNVLRNKRRSFLTGLSISVAVTIVIFLWTFVSGVLDDLFTNYVTASTGHIRILNRDYLRRETMMPLSASIYNYKSIIKTVEKNKDVKLATGRIKFGVLMDVKGKSKPIMGVGIDPVREESVLRLSQKIIKGRVIVAGTKEANIGVGLAKDLGLNAGDTLTVITQTSGGSLSGMNLKIAGIFSMGTIVIDNRTFYIPIDQAQDLLDMNNRVTEIFLLVKNPDNSSQIAANIQKTLTTDLIARPWQDNGFLYFMMMIARNMYASIYAFILILASFTILNAMSMAVMERTKEIGMMKALGMREKEIRRLIILEAMILGIAASFIGAFFGTLLSYYISAVGIDYTVIFEKMGNVEMPLSNIYRGLFSWTTIFVGFLLGVMFSVLAAIFPALRAARLEATEAMRE